MFSEQILKLHHHGLLERWDSKDLDYAEHMTQSPETTIVEVCREGFHIPEGKLMQQHQLQQLLPLQQEQWSLFPVLEQMIVRPDLGVVILMQCISLGTTQIK